MTDAEFDEALIAAAMRLGAEQGWRRVTVAEAARRAGLPLDRARGRFPFKHAVLLRFGERADRLALALVEQDGAPRDRLFDILMRRIDYLQTHRDGVVALLRGLPADPATAAMLGLCNLGSMRWMLEAAGISARGLRGTLRAQGLVAVWLATIRAWMNDTGEDLSATMAALDKALNRAERMEGWFGRAAASPATPMPAASAEMPADVPVEDVPPAPPPSDSAFDPPNV